MYTKFEVSNLSCTTDILGGLKTGFDLEAYRRRMAAVPGIGENLGVRMGVGCGSF